MLIRLTWDMPTETAHVALCRRTARMLLEHSHIVEEDIDVVELIIGELCANVIRHAYDSAGGRYSVEVALDGLELRLSVTDKGRGFNVSQLPPEPRFSEAGGMGLFLIGHFADRCEFQLVNGGGSAVVANRTLRRRPGFHARLSATADAPETQAGTATTSSGRTPKLS